MDSIRDYQPIFALDRGGKRESVHFGAIAVVNAEGKLIASFGNPQAVTYLRSSAKPFQVLPLLDHCGAEYFGLTLPEIAIMCASHSGTDEHVAVVRGLQAKTGVQESELLCGVHPPYDPKTAELLKQRGEAPTPNRHNCSGKHTGMLAFARMLREHGYMVEEAYPYIDPRHPVQQKIVQAIAEMCALPQQDVFIAMDGCSAPNFALPLERVALGYARLFSPEKVPTQTTRRAESCSMVTRAMTSYPNLVGGPGRMDSVLMEVAQGAVLAKGGAEAFQGMALPPRVLSPQSPAIGIAFKIADGDARNRVRAAVALEVLRQLHVLSKDQLQKLEEFGPEWTIRNWRGLEVGKAYPIFELEWKN